MSFSFENYLQAHALTFKGRATRSEFWSYYGFTTIYGVVLGLLSVLSLEYLPKIFGQIFLIVLMLFGIYAVVFSIPVSIRRLHDTGRTGMIYAGYLLIAIASNFLQPLLLIQFVFNIVMLVFFCEKSDPGTNQYGPCPK